MKTAHDILQLKQVTENIVHPDSNVLDALKAMKKTNQSYVIVIEDGKFFGVMAEKDYSQKVILLNRHSEDTKVRDIVESFCPVIQATDTLDKCLAMMEVFNTRYLAVLDNFTFIGVITMHDLIKDNFEEKRSNDALQF